MTEKIVSRSGWTFDPKACEWTKEYTCLGCKGTFISRKQVPVAGTRKRCPECTEAYARARYIKRNTEAK